MKRWMGLGLILAVLLSGCGKKQPSAPPMQEVSYDALSAQIYEQALGEFYRLYEDALEETVLSERYRKMAMAEAQLLYSGVILPLYSSGGNFAISRIAPHSQPSVDWGSDADRMHSALVMTQPIGTEDYQALEALFDQQKGTGNYREQAINYLLSRGYTPKDRLTIGYTTDPEIYDVLASGKAVDSRVLVNTYDALYEYDLEGVQQPALAESYEKIQNSDGTVSYRFALRDGVFWVDAQGRQIDQVRADDFVAGMQHTMDAMGGLEYLVKDVIVGASEYITGQLTDFSQVGVSAPDERTVVYRLTSDIPYFMTMLGYGVFAPLCRSYYVSRGGRFGADFDPADPAYTYGKSPDTIAYCGPYLIANATAHSTILFRENPAYWNKDGVAIKEILWLYNDGSEELKNYTDVMAGTIDTATLTAAAVEKAKSDGVFDALVHKTEGDATTYFLALNLNRTATANFNDPTVGVSAKTAAQQEKSRQLLQNQSFRLALCRGLDRGAYNAQRVGESQKYTALRNTLVPGDFVYLPESAGEFPKGTAYGQMVDHYMQAGVTLYDAGTDGFDGWFDPAAAKLLLDQAARETGLNISQAEPVVLDMPYDPSSAVSVNCVNACKLSLQQTFSGAVVLNPVACRDRSGVNYAGYFIPSGAQANYDLYPYSGWGPDYGDPKTYLDTLLPDYSGYMTRMLGIF